MESVGVPEAVRQFLKDQSIVDHLAYALLGGPDESKLNETLVDVFKSGGCDMSALKDVIAVKKR